MAEQEKEVAELAKEAAEFKKQEQILLGEGEAARKRAVMEADGALKEKLEAYVRVNQMYADALRGYGGSLVPHIVMGGPGATGNQQGLGMVDLLNLFAVKAARDLSLDLGVQTKNVGLAQRSDGN